MANVFITYRRSDSSSATGRIADRLQSFFGPDSVFYDISTIPLGVDFRTFINEKLNKTDIFLVVIGDGWLDIRDANGNRKIDNPEDWVRIEVSAALARKNIPVIPVMVGKMSNPPKKEELPDELSDLSSRNSIILRSDSTFEGQMDKLIDYIDSHLKEVKIDEPANGIQLLVGRDKDNVLMQTKHIKNGSKNLVQFSLSTAHNIKWWKALKIYDKRGMISLLSTQDDDHGPKKSHLIDISSFGNEIKVEFYKAKVFGVHSRVHKIKLPTSKLKNLEVSFTWLTD